jgi:hypothetical protein
VSLFDGVSFDWLVGIRFQLHIRSLRHGTVGTPYPILNVLDGNLSCFARHLLYPIHAHGLFVIYCVPSMHMVFSTRLSS